METILIIILLFLLLAALVTGILRKWDRREQYDQEEKPYHSTPKLLASEGLIFEEKWTRGQGQSVYAITPAGEAMLRAWLRNPGGDPGILEDTFPGLVTPFDRGAMARRRSDLHAERLAEYERIAELLTDRPEWRYALEAARTGIRFERHCLTFWREAVTVTPFKREDAA